MYLAVEPKSRWHKSVAILSTLQGHSNKHREAEVRHCACPHTNIHSKL